MYKEKWYKVFHTFVAYNGKTYETFEYAFGDKQTRCIVQKYEDEGTFSYVEEWKI